MRFTHAALLLVLIACAAFTSGCASSGHAPDPALSGYGNYAYPMYADLEQTDTGWRFVNLSPERDDREIRLNDLRYYGNKDGGGSGCVRGFFGATEGNCDRNNDALDFQTSDFTTTDYVLSAAMLPLTQPLALFLSPFVIANDAETTDMVVLPVYGASGFDEHGYWAAIAEARDQDQFHERFPRIHRQFVALYEAMERYQPPVMRATNAAEIRAEGISWHEDYWQHLLRDLTENLQWQVVDDSGLAPESLRSAGLSAIEIDTALSADRAAFIDSLEQVQAPSMRRPTWFNNVTFNGIAHMENMVRFQGDRFDQVSADNVRRIEEAHERIPELNEANTQRLNSFIEAILTARLEANVQPSDDFVERWDAFDKNFEIPEALWVNGTGAVEGGDVTLRVESLSMDHRFTPSLSGGNEDLTLTVEGDRLILENRSDQYITLDRASFYYRDQVLTLSGDQTRDLEELPPGVSRSQELPTLFDLESLDTRHTEVTRESAADTLFPYGFAFRYQITGESTPQALTQVTRPSLLELMESNGVIDNL